MYDGKRKAMFWVGWLLTLLPALMLLSGSVTAALKLPMVQQGLGKYGFSASFLPVLAAAEFLCGVLFLVPRTAVLGALLITAYMGGAVVTHLRAGEAQWMVPVLFAAVAWAGLWLRRPGLFRAMAAGDDPR